MDIRIILGIYFVTTNVFLVVGADYNGKNVTKSRIHSNEMENYSFERSKNSNGKLRLANIRPESKMSKMLLQSNVQSIGKLKMVEKSDPLEEGNRKIVTFGKRVFQSIKRHGIMAKDVPLLKSGKYRIDWWKQNRRLQGMRKRLAQQLDTNLELKLRIESLGWRNNSAQITHHKKINADQADMENPTRTQNKDVQVCILYKIFVIDTGEMDSPMKVSLSTGNRPDLGATTTDFGVSDVMSGELPISNENGDSTSNQHSGDQVVDGDRFLQLIPLIVEELRQGLMSKKERQAFKEIFGKRLWQLLDREASKRLVQPMDYELAKFLFTGELPKRESKNVRRERNKKQNGLTQTKRTNRQHVRIHDIKKK